MDLLLSEEQGMLRDSAATFTDRYGGPNRLRDLWDKNKKLDSGVWTKAAEAGWMAIVTPEINGGLGLGLTELCLIAEQMGKGLMPDPVTAVAAVARAVEERAEAIITGKCVVLPALMETTRCIGDETPGVTATPAGDLVTLEGTKTGVAMLCNAAQFLVSFSGTAGIGLALVDANNVAITAAKTVDGTTTGSIRLNQSIATVVAGPSEAPSRISALLDALHISNAAELLGIMEAAQMITVEHLKTREQFDKPIGAFQALQHRAADNLAAIELSRSLVYKAAAAIETSTGTPGLASAALSRCATSALDVCKSAIQMHGGIGFTDEYDIGLYLKRAMTLATRYGSAGLHRKRYSEIALENGSPKD